MELERRAAAAVALEGRALAGHAIVFDTRSRDLGGFVEIVRREAVARALQADADIVALYNHDAGQVLGRTPRTLQLRADARGLAFALQPPDTTAGRDALELVRRGDVGGASFGFTTRKDRWRTEGGVTIRELLDIDIREISLVAFPAYPDTDVALAQRALRAFQTQQRRDVDRLRRRHRVWMAVR